MKTKFLAVVTLPPAIYHGLSTQKKLWEDKFTRVNMASGVRRNVRKHREIKNSEKYTALDIYSELDCLEKREVTSSESRDYMGRSGKGMTTSLTLRAKWPNKKQKGNEFYYLNY